LRKLGAPALSYDDADADAPSFHGCGRRGARGFATGGCGALGGSYYLTYRLHVRADQLPPVLDVREIDFEAGRIEHDAAFGDDACNNGIAGAAGMMDDARLRRVDKR
jgi:hypothetical protein